MTVSFVMLLTGSFTFTCPRRSFEAAETAWSGSLLRLSLSTVGYRFVKFCLYLRLENSAVVGDIFPIKQVR